MYSVNLVYKTTTSLYLFKYIIIWCTCLALIYHKDVQSKFFCHIYFNIIYNTLFGRYFLILLIYNYLRERKRKMERKFRLQMNLEMQTWVRLSALWYSALWVSMCFSFNLLTRVNRVLYTRRKISLRFYC